MRKILIVLLIGSTLFSCQEQRKERIIEQFVINLFDDKVTPQSIVSTYIEILQDTTNSNITPTERLKGAEGLVRETRKGIGEKGMWIIPNYSIKQIKNPKVYSFNDYEHLSVINLNAIDSIRNRVYVLLNPDKNEILQYFLLNESETKIISYTLLVKDGNNGSFFRP